MEEYDQSVTCLADDLQTLEILSNKLRTPGNLAQTNSSIHKQSLKQNSDKTRKDPNQTRNKEMSKLNKKPNLTTLLSCGLDQVHVISYDSQKETTQTELRNLSYDQKKIQIQI